MADRDHTIKQLLAQRSDLDARILTIDERVSVLLDEQEKDTDPQRSARDAAIRDLFLMLGDLLYELGRVSATIDARAAADRAQAGDTERSPALRAFQKRRRPVDDGD